MKYYKEIKSKLIENENYSRIKDYSKERYKLNTYYEVGKMLSEAGKHYGKGIIKEYSKRLTEELNKGYSVTNLKYMRSFYEYAKSQPVADQLSWSHYTILLPLKDKEKINYYIKISIQNTLSKRKLKQRINSQEYYLENIK